MKIFLTGCAGFLGSHLADALIAQGHRVSGCDNLSGGEIENVPKLVQFYQADCRNLDAMRELTAGADVVVHCAAIACEGLSVFSPSTITDSIYGASISVFSAAIANGVKKILFCSSMARYGNGRSPFREHYKPEPVDPYGIAKVAAEKTLRMLCLTHGVDYAIAVPHSLFGPRQCYTDPYRNVVAIMANRLLQHAHPIIYGDGEQVRSFTYIDDAVGCLATMATGKNVNGLTVNIGPDNNEITINELCRLLQESTGVALKPIYVADRPAEVKIAACSAALARTLLDFKDETPLEEGLVKLVAYIRERGPKPFDYRLPIEIETKLTPQTWTERLL